MSIAALAAALLALAVLGGWLRLARWQAAAPVRTAGWRLALLAAGQPALAANLYLALYPPVVSGGAAATLTVLTRGAGSPAGQAIGLPEAGGRGRAQAPDLATALRRQPGTRALHVLGQGLEPRDREAARGLRIRFDPPPLPRGLVALAPPPGPVAPGAAFRLGGQAAGLAGGSAALVDPADREVDRVPLDAGGGFALAGAARVPGAALFRVRLRDAAGRAVEEADAPLWVTPAPPVRVLFLAGAAGPEVKFWRRWAADAGVAATVPVAAGNGLLLGDPRPPLTTAALARYDLVIVDERSWDTLALAERAALAVALRAGTGLLLRVTGPLGEGTRRAWAAMGMPLLAGDQALPVTLRPVAGTAPPALLRRMALAPGASATPIVQDAAGAALVAWRPVAEGRLGVWTLADAAGLVTAGEGARFGEMWATTVATLARPVATRSVTISPLPVAGERLDLCGLAAGARVIGPGDVAAPAVDPAAGDGCAGYWPRAAGWHLLRGSGPDRAFYVYPAGALPALRAAERRDATLALAQQMRLPSAGGVAPPGNRGPSWPWLLAWLLVAGSLWWLERASAGRADPA